MMPDSLTTNSPIIAAYRAATPGSAARAERAAQLFPSGITHDSRYIEPYGLYITRAQGPRKSPIRPSRRASPRNTRNTGALPIHGMSGNSAPRRSRRARSCTQITEACW